MNRIRFLSLLLVTILLFSLLPVNAMAEDAITPGDSFTYTKEDNWGIDDGIWSWQWALADSHNFSDMTFTTVDGQGECYVADWALYPYCAARSGGINVHPNAKADAARVFTAPATGWVTVTATVARGSDVAVATKATPTSFRILLENATVYPTKGDYQVLSTKEAEHITLQVFLKKGELLRFVVGAMDNQTSDSVTLQTTVTYDTVTENAGEVCRVGETFTHKKTSATWGTADPHWSWEWALAGKTAFSPMTWQYVEKYGKEMYASDWTAHPYNYVDSLGVKLHPAESADTAKTFTVPYTGTVKLDTEVSRYTALADVNNTAANGTSLRILVNSTQVYPLYSGYLVLDSTTPKDFSVALPVTKGDKIRIVIGGMGQVTSDAVKMYNTVTYTDLNTPELCVDDKETFSVNATQFSNNTMGNWSFEYRDSNDTFGNMTYQYIEAYSKYMYASDWTAHEYNYIDLLGVKMHPSKTRDAVKTYTAPHDGRIEMAVKVARYNEYVAEGSKNPTSLRVYKNNEQIWPTNGGQKELTSATATTFRISADVRVGDKIRCVVGSMGNTTADGISMYNTVTYRAVGLRELAAFMDQYHQRIDVIDVQGDNLNSAERAWSWKPTTALGFTELATFNSPTDAKIRYNKTSKKYVVAVCSSRGFMGLVDFATGKKLWQVSLTGNPNPHAIEYLPNGNVAVAASIDGWIRVYTASQGSTSAKYAEVALEGAHGVLWDPGRKVLWCLGNKIIAAYTVGGTAAAPTLTEVTKYRGTLPNGNGHDLSPVYGNQDRLWISSDSIYQYDIPSKQFLQTYDYGGTISRAGVKGISNFPDSHTTVHVFPNNTYLVHDSDRVFVTLTDRGDFFGKTHSHSTGAYYKVRSWISAYNAAHKVHVPSILPGKAPTCEASGLSDGTACSLCGMTLNAQQILSALGHNYVAEVTPPSCVEGGYTTYTCSRCDHSHVADPVGHIGHVYDGGFCIHCGKSQTLKGMRISILGDSISTYAGVSDNPSYNSTLSGGKAYYTDGTLGVYQKDTWWQQTIDATGMELLVNNSASNSCILTERYGIPGAYLDRCVQLHNEAGEDPDIIAVYLGTNDFWSFHATLGTAEAIDYQTLIRSIGNGYTYAPPTTACEAYAILLHKITERYPGAEVYCFTLFPVTSHPESNVQNPEDFNASIAQIAEHFGATVVDLYGKSGIKADETFSFYIGDNMLHPGPAGMDAITGTFTSAILKNSRYVSDPVYDVTYDLTKTIVNQGTAYATLENAPFACDLTAPSNHILHVRVTMDGQDITGSAYADNSVRIERVTGPIHITAQAWDASAPLLDGNIRLYHSLNLTSDISINYAVLRSQVADYADLVLECSIPTYDGNICTGSTTVDIFPVEVGSYYYFTLDGLTAVNMNDEITATLHMTKGGKSYLSKPDTYSIATYAYSQLSKNSAGDALHTLCADLLTYGARAQIYKNYRTDAPADAAMTEIMKESLTDLNTVTFGNTNEELSDITAPTVLWRGKALDLNAKVGLKYIVNLTDFTGKLEDLRLKVSYVNLNGEVTETYLTELQIYNEAGRLYAFTFDGLLGAELRTVVSAQVYEGDTPVSVTLRYSPDTYGNNKSGALLELCKALFAYSDSAKAYFRK